MYGLWVATPLGGYLHLLPNYGNAPRYFALGADPQQGLVYLCGLTLLHARAEGEGAVVA